MTPTQVKDVLTLDPGKFATNGVRIVLERRDTADPESSTRFTLRIENGKALYDKTVVIQSNGNAYYTTYSNQDFSHCPPPPVGASYTTETVDEADTVIGTSDSTVTGVETQSVTVPAGTFDNTSRITASGKSYSSFGTTDFTQTTNWADAIGEVKMVLTSTTGSSSITGVFELKSCTVCP